MVSIALLRRSPKGGGGHGGGGGGGGGHGSSGGGGGKGSSSSGSTTKGGGVVVVGGGGGGNNHHGHGGGGGSHLPLWAIFLIVYFSIFTLLFVVSLVYYCRKERKSQRQGKSFRPWYAIWKSFCIASGLWIFIWLIKLAREAVEKKATKRGHGGSSRPSGRASFPIFRAGGAGSGAYTKVDEGGGSGGPHSTGGGLTAPWPPNTPHIFGSSNISVSSSPYEQQQRNGTGTRYEPMGYSGATYAPPRPDRQQPIITGPIQQTSAIPLPRSRSPSPAPSSIMTTSDPPPYPYSESAGGAYSRPPGGDTERLLRTPAPLLFPVPALRSPGSKH